MNLDSKGSGDQEHNTLQHHTYCVLYEENKRNITTIDYQNSYLYTRVEYLNGLNDYLNFH
ncbi:hypothetical protein RhiirA5_427138 [Rhizophagus irregularis]|uniref:Uncharacterized protein n=1 Tax=Rhizophagus irregularis TaxID=588596 RepID=A0A2I1E559_9GLOM|nr:hypothetical protein RhiirA5_427138 [Rhizophagus irregularis]PKY17262.1 hypothetical protein RhiirB3_429826 [Rhizophagus irregularis]